MKIHFHMDEKIVNEMTWEEYEAIELAKEGQIKMYRLRPLMARFMVDEQMAPVRHEVAMMQLGKVQMQDLEELIRSFVEGMSMQLVPKANGNSSAPHSEVSEGV